MQTELNQIVKNPEESQAFLDDKACL